MRSDDIFNGINEIDDALIREAKNIPAVTGILFRRICASAAILILAAGLTMLIHNSGAEKTLEIGKNNDVIISDETENSVFCTTAFAANVIEQENISQTITENITASSEPADIEVSSIHYETTEIPTEAESETDINIFPQSPALPSEIPDYDGTEGIGSDTDKEDFSFIPIEQWLEDTDVVWGENNLKGTDATVEIPLGTAEISPDLQKIMEENPEQQTIFAVTVDFSASIDENEMNHWEYNGNTLAEIMTEIKSITENTDNTDMDGAKDKLKQLKMRVVELKTAYYSKKIESFRSTFEQNGLGIYPSQSDGAFFCTFGTAVHFYEFNCSDNEAFVFYPAGYFK